MKTFFFYAALITPERMSLRMRRICKNDMIGQGKIDTLMNACRRFYNPCKCFTNGTDA